MSIRILPAQRGLIIAGPALLAGASLATFAFLFDGPVCLGYGGWAAFFLLPLVFSVSVIFLVWRVTSSLLAMVLPYSRLAGLGGLVIAVGLHFGLGLAGWALYPDVPEQDNADVRIATWIPFWIVGLFFKFGHLALCD